MTPERLAEIEAACAKNESFHWTPMVRELLAEIEKLNHRVCPGCTEGNATLCRVITERDQLKAEVRACEREEAYMDITLDEYYERAEAWKLAAEACEDIVTTDDHFEFANDVALDLIKAARALEEDTDVVK